MHCLYDQLAATILVSLCKSTRDLGGTHKRIEECKYRSIPKAACPHAEKCGRKSWLVGAMQA